MAAKFMVLAAVVTACSAKPFYISAIPELTDIRASRAPSIAYGFGSGFASDIGGIKHSNSIGASFQTGNAEAYGSGIGSTDGNVFASGNGFAHTYPNTYRTVYPVYTRPYATRTYSYPYNLGYNHFGAQQVRNSYGNAVSPAQNFGNAVASAQNIGNAASSAQNIGNAASSAQNIGNAAASAQNFGNAASSAQNFGNYGTTIAQSQNGPHGSSASAANINPYQSPYGFRGASIASAVSTGYGATAASSSDGLQGGYNTAVSASENVGGVRASTAQTVQQNGGSVQHSGATSIDGPGIQASHSHAVNTGAGTFY